MLEHTLAPELFAHISLSLVINACHPFEKPKLTPSMTTKHLE
jgi:hypothetical protein